MKRLIPLLFGLILSLLLVEGLVRVWLARRTDGPRPSDRPKVYYFSERSKLTSDYLYTREKPANTYRIVVIGDSFAYGYGNLFDDAFPKRLERILNLNDTPTRVEVINMGVPGYSTRDEVGAVRNALAFSPDLVLLEITLNDPEEKEFSPHDRKVDKKGSIVVEGGIYDYWKTLALVASRIKNARSVYEYKRYFQTLWEDEGTVRNFRVSLRNITELARGANVRLAAVVFPLVTFPLDESYPFFHAHEVAGETLKALGVKHLDLFKAFEGLDPYRLQAEPGADPHPNEIAHRIATEALYQWLKRERLIPREAIVHYTDSKRTGPTRLIKRVPRESKKHVPGTP